MESHPLKTPKTLNLRILKPLPKPPKTPKIHPEWLTWQSLLEEFSGQSVEMACCLLEGCGRFLLRSPQTTLRAQNLLETFLRLRKAHNLDARLATLVDNAYFQCKPPERGARLAKERSPLRRYIRKLLFAELDRRSIERILKQLRKIPWGGENGEGMYLAKCFVKVHRMKYGQLSLYASLAAGLARYHDELVINIVDQVH